MYCVKFYQNFIICFPQLLIDTRICLHEYCTQHTCTHTTTHWPYMLHSAHCALIQIEAINYFCLFGIKIDKSLLKWHITRNGKSIKKMDDFSIDSLSSGVLCTILITLWILKCIVNWKFNHTVNYVIYFKNKTAVVFLLFYLFISTIWLRSNFSVWNRYTIAALSLYTQLNSV